MAHVSDIVLRRSIAIDSLQTHVIAESMLDVEGLTPEAVQVDAVLHRFFDAFALNEYLSAKAGLSRHDEIDYLVIDASIVEHLQSIVEAAYSGQPERVQVLAAPTLGQRFRNAIESLTVEDARGNLAQLNFALTRLASYVDQPEFTVFYRAEGN